MDAMRQRNRPLALTANEFKLGRESQTTRARHRESVEASSAGGDLHPARKYQPSTAAVKGSNIL